jgi:hypothetical protein
MSKPLQFGDPGELGPFRLESRLHESAAGIVYLGADPQGRPVEVALLTTAAAGDPAARDRFRAAVAAEAPRVGVPHGFPAPEGAAPVVAALPEGGAPWVATAHVDGRAGAERFLGPALRVDEPPAPVTAEGDTKGLAAAVVSLAALLLLLAFLVLLLFSCEPSDTVPRPTEVPTTVPATQVPPPPPPTPTPVSPSPTPGKTGKRTPHPTPTDGEGTVNPAAD